MTPAPSPVRARRFFYRVATLVGASALVLATACGSSTAPTTIGKSSAPLKVTTPAHAGSAAAVTAVDKAFASRTYIEAKDPASNGGGRRSKADIHYCNGCQPPLVYNGGPVIDTTPTTGLTITPIFWVPAGSTGSNAFPAGYQSIISGYIKNVAAASNSNSNIYSVASEYYQDINGVKTALRYKITAGTPIVDTSLYPPTDSSCTLTQAYYTACITDAQLRTEMTKVTTAKAQPADLAHFYPVFFAPNVETYDLDGSNSDSSFCGYHRAFTTGAAVTDYGNEPYTGHGGCDGGEAPNGNLAADGAVGTLSHEISEALTDPTADTAWNDATGHEIGDVCSGNFGPPLGSTNASNPLNTAYNQVINGGKYYTQTEFSNAAYGAFGVGNGCVASEGAVTTAATAGNPAALAAVPLVNSVATAMPVVATITNDAFPNSLPADGKSTSDLDVALANPTGLAIENDKINYLVYAIDGNGSCGTISAASSLTDSGGHAHVLYTASTDNVLCAVVATDVYGGRSSTGVIYQGSFQAQAVVAKQNFPKKLTLGHTSTFTVAFKNPSTKPQLDARILFGIFPGEGATQNVKASQVELSYSTTGKPGTYKRVSLRGATITDGEIQGLLLPPAGITIGANKTLTVHFRIELEKGISTKAGGAGLGFEAYLDQVNPASGSLSTFADTLSYQVKVKK